MVVARGRTGDSAPEGAPAETQLGRLLLEGPLFNQGAQRLDSWTEEAPARRVAEAAEDDTPVIADLLRRAIADKEWTISRAAKEADVDRSFLSRLLSGHPPPKARDGRKPVELDPRYQKIAQALTLDEVAFLNAVAAEQDSVRSRDPDEYALLLSRAVAALPRRYEPEVIAEVNLLVGQLGPTIRRVGGPMELYHQVRALPAMRAGRRVGSAAQPEVIVSNHKGKDPLWEDDHLPPLADALIELGYRCHTADADVGLDVRFDMAAVLQKLGTRDPDAVRALLGVEEG